MEVQLEMDFSQDEIKIVECSKEEHIDIHKPYVKAESITNKCKHNIRIKSFKKDYLSYCSKCGKIFSVKRKKGE